MASHPFLKSIKPVNLLSFGPNTKEIELRPLNILIGSNGSGKSNLIEVIGLLSNLPDRHPWSTVIQTGGAREWIWKGRSSNENLSLLAVEAAGSLYPIPKNPGADILKLSEKRIGYSIEIQERDSSFEVASEILLELDRSEDDPIQTPRLERSGWTGQIQSPNMPNNSPDRFLSLDPSRSVLSMYGTSGIGTHVPSVQKFSESVERIAVYRDWAFGSDSRPRERQRAGLDSSRLAADLINLAQVLKAWRDRGASAVFERLVDLMRKFYEPLGT